MATNFGQNFGGFGTGGFGGGYAAGPAPAPAPAAAAPAGGAGVGETGLVYDVTELDFEALVLERSLEVPVLLDLWAPWCGPCRSLGPVLEKLAQAYGGRFVLAKLNTDEAPQISAALRIRSIPLVVLFAGGRPVDQFVGALPEGQIRSFLDKHLGAPAPEAAAEPEFGPLDEAEALLEEGALDEAQALLDALPAEARDERHAKLVKRLALARNRPEGDAGALAARIAANPRDFEARFGLGALLVHEGRYTEGFEQLLEVVLRARGEAGAADRERARKQLVEWFDACPDDAAVSQGRRYLGMYLN